MQFKSTTAFYNNFFLTECKGRTGKYWPGILARGRGST